MGDGPLQLFAGNSNRPLAIEIGEALGARLGNAVVGTFRNGEVRVRIEDNVRGADVFVLQSLCPPIHHHIWELLLMLDALKRASARRITAVVPYYAYARQERKTAGREGRGDLESRDLFGLWSNLQGAHRGQQAVISICKPKLRY